MAGLDDVLGSAGDISAVLAEIAKQRAQGRVAEAGVNQSQAGAEANLYRTQMDAALKGPVQSAQAAALGDTMANIQPFRFTGDTQMVGNIPVPQATGGLTPANFGPATRSAGASLASLGAGRVNSPSFALPKVPKLTPLPESSALDSILNAAGGIGSAAGAAGKNGGSANLIDIAKDIVNKLRGNGGQTPYPTQSSPYGPMEPGAENASSYPTYGQLPGAGDYDLGGGGAPAVDPSLATGYDPVAEFEAWLRQQQQGGGGDEGLDELDQTEWPDGWGE